MRFQQRVFSLLLISLYLSPVLVSSQDLRQHFKEKDKEDYEDNIKSRKFHIGAILADRDVAAIFQNTIEDLNFDGVSVPATCTLYHVSVISSGSPIRDARLVCNELIARGVFALVIGGGNLSSAATSAVSYTGGFYDIPVIGTSARDSAFSNKNIHVTFLRTVPSVSHQANVWVEILQFFKYKCAVFIHSSNSDGRSLLNKLRTLAETMQDDRAVKVFGSITEQRIKIQLSSVTRDIYIGMEPGRAPSLHLIFRRNPKTNVTSVINFEPGVRDVGSLLQPLAESLVRVFILFANKYDANVILEEASKMNLTGKGSVWILTEDAIEAKLAPIGAIGLRLKHASNQTAHIRDSLKLISHSLKKLYEETPELIIRPPNTCEMEDPWNITGRLLFRTMQRGVLFDGDTGKVSFDYNGDRQFAEYDVINIRKGTESANERKISLVGQYFYDKVNDEMRLELNGSHIIWGGGASKPPSGISVPRQLKVLTTQETPFLYAERMDENEKNCTLHDESVCYSIDNKSHELVTKCCYGYCVELLNKLAEMNDFSFTLYLSSDQEYGTSYVGDKGQTIWTGMIGQITNKSSGADMIVAPLTINPERAQAIDFTKPFKYQGITILVKKAKRPTALVSILQPFQFNLWMMLLATVHAIAMMVWLLDRLSPMFKNDGTQFDSLKISEAFWFSWGVILNSGLGEGTPRCLSARVMSMIWAGFAMIIVASYTANLAAFLVLEDRGQTITGVNDPKLRNPVENFRFGTVRGSAVDMFFRRKTEWANMYRMMEANNYCSAQDAIAAVKNGSLKAFIWDSSRLEYEASMDCELITVGELFGRSGYGIGIRKDMFWSEKITLDVLELHESGFMADLDDKWIWAHGVECPPDRTNSPQRLGLANLEGIFMMVIGGVVAGTVLVIIELMYKKYKAGFAMKTNELPEGVDCLAESQSSEITPEALQGYCQEHDLERSHSSSWRCEICERQSRGGHSSLCPFGSHTVFLYPDLETRLARSLHLPSQLKSMNNHEMLRLEQKRRRKLKDRGSENPNDLSSPFLSDDELHEMLECVEKNEIPDLCSCSFETNVSNPSADRSVLTGSRDWSSRDSESIISGEFSCHHLHACKKDSGRMSN